MDKKNKIVAIILTTLISMAVSVVACVLGVSPDSLIGATDTDVSTACTVSCVYDN